jgi:hypothetical protein
MVYNNILERVKDKYQNGTVFKCLSTGKLKTSTGLIYANLQLGIESYINLNVDFSENGVLVIRSTVREGYADLVTSITNINTIVDLCKKTFPKGTTYICVESGKEIVSTGIFNFCTEAGVVEFRDGKYYSTVLTLGAKPKLARIVNEPEEISIKDEDLEKVKKALQALQHSNRTMADTKTTETNSSKNNGGRTDYYQFKKEWEQIQDVIEERDMNYAQGNILKAAFTFNLGRHNGTDELREINKIIFFAERQKELILKQRKK